MKTVARRFFTLSIAASAIVAAGQSETQGLEIVSGSVVAASNGTPISKASITLVDARGQRGQATTTDDAGRFRTSALPGRYRLLVRAEGFLDGWYRGANQAAGEPEVLVPSAQPVQVRLHALPLIEGSVKDGQNVPLPGVRVTLYRTTLTGGSVRYTSAGEAVSNSSGLFSFSLQKPGRFIVAAGVRSVVLPSGASASALEQTQELRTRMGFKPVGAPRTMSRDLVVLEDGPSGSASPRSGAAAFGWAFSGGSTEPASAIAVSVDAGEIRQTELVLRSRPLRPITGTVKDGGAGVMVRAVFDSLGPFEKSIELAATVTEGSGAFRLLVPDSAVRLRFQGTAGWADQMVSVGSLPLEVSLTPWATIRGHVTYQPDASASSSSRRLRVVFEPTTGILDAPIKRANVEAGSFVLTGLGPEAGVLRIYGLPPSAIVSSTRIVGEPLQNGEAALVPRHYQALEVDLEIEGTGPTVSGTIGGDSAHLLGASVMIFPTAVPTWTNNGISDPRFKELAVQERTFEFRGVPRGEYYVVAVRNGRFDLDLWRVPEQLSQLAALARRVDVKGDMKIDLAIR